MAKIHHEAFVQFVTTGRAQRNGALRMNGNTVWSYDTLIAHVDRTAQRVFYNPRTYSLTTNRHQKAVLVGAAHLGWTVDPSRC